MNQICCLNPDCPGNPPLNPETNKYCQYCRTPLVPRLIHRFRIVRPLGRGGFGKTYLAEDAQKLNERCVVKQLAYQASGTQAAQKVVQLFEQEAKQLQRLGIHPQIPTLLAYFEEGHYLYLAQEFVEGQDLLKELQQQGVFSETKIRALLLDLLPVLQFIHERGVIHRDLKPENIMRRRQDDKLVLIDFGVSKELTQSQLLITGTIVGSQGYAPREQMKEGKATPASDLFSLGVTCFHLLSQVLPYQLQLDYGYTWTTTWRQHLRIAVSQELGQVLDRLLVTEVAQRYQTATAVLQDLQPPTPVATPPVPPTAPVGPVLTAPSQPQPASPRPTIPQPRIPARSSRPPNRRKFLVLAGMGGVGVTTVVVWPVVKRFLTPAPTLQRFAFETVKVDAQGQIIEKLSKEAEFFTEDLGNGVTLEMVKIPGGNFRMGSPESEEGRDNNEGPQREVTVASFYMGKFEVTQAQWRVVAALPKVNRDLEADPVSFKGDNRPVERVSWFDAEEFCQRLSKQTGRDYRLPSEAEWEYACRAGTTTPFHFGPTMTPELANYDGTSTYGSGPKGEYRESTTEVGTFPPNAFGLYDMHGNVWEWCEDHDHQNYQGAPNNGSAWIDENADTNSLRVLRGGSWIQYPVNCRSALRFGVNPGRRGNVIGLRVVCSGP